MERSRNKPQAIRNRPEADDGPYQKKGRYGKKGAGPYQREGHPTKECA
jgi:hypothetical protein